MNWANKYVAEKKERDNPIDLKDFNELKELIENEVYKTKHFVFQEQNDQWFIRRIIEVEGNAVIENGTSTELSIRMDEIPKEHNEKLAKLLVMTKLKE